MGSPERPLDVEMGDMSEEAKLNPVDVDVKTDSDLKKNGEVKEQRFTGLKKEELLKISSQSHWVKARWFLFILFWIIWVAMLVGAILIVVNAPRCKPEPKPEWYQDTVVYEVDAKQYAGGLEGTKKHLPYLEALHTKSIMLTSAANPDDVQAVNGNESIFNELVAAVHEKDGGRVLIDVIVDSFPITSSYFIQSASAECAESSPGEFCDFFLWKDGNASQANDDWGFSETRKALFKKYGDRAYINYSSNKALDFISATLQIWFDRGVDGVKIRDIAKLQNISETEFVSAIWYRVFEKNETAEDKTARALFVYSSSPNAEITPIDLAGNDTNTAHSPVFLNDEIVRVVNQPEAGKKMKNILSNWRNQARNIAGFMVSPVGGSLAAERFPNLAAGLNLLSMTLPGVPILRSGDEMAAVSPVFTWSEDSARDSKPLNGSAYVRGQTEELIVRRVAGIQAEQSLRYDTRSNDTTFVFLDSGNNDTIAFKRKWDQKKAILVVSNLSPNNHTVSLMVDGGLMKENDLAKKAKVLISSLNIFDKNSMSVDLGEVEMPSGLTLVLST